MPATPEVVAHHDAAHRGIEVEVEAALVVGLLGDVLDDVVFGDEVVAGEGQGGGRAVAQDAAADRDAEAFGGEGAVVGAAETLVVFDETVGHHVVGAAEAGAVSPAHRDAGGGQVAHRAAFDPVPHSPVDEGCGGPEVLERAVRDPDVAAAGDLDAAAAAFAQAQAAQGHALTVLERQHEAGAEGAERHGGAVGVHAFRRIPVEAAGRAVEVPFAGGVDLAEEVQAEEAQAVAEGFAALDLHHALLRVDAGDGAVGVGPVVEPVAAGVGRGLPGPAVDVGVPVLEDALHGAGVAVFDRGNGRRSERAAAVGKPLVGVAREGLLFPVAIEHRALALLDRVSPVRDALGAEVGPPEALAGRRGDAAEDLSVAHTLPSLHLRAAAENGLPGVARLEDDAEYVVERQGRLQGVNAPEKADRVALADGVHRALRAGEGTLARAGAVVIPVRCHIKDARCRLGTCRHRDRGRCQEG